MDKKKQPSGDESPVDPDLLAAVIVPAVIFLSGFVSYILYYDYGPFTPEALLSYAVLVITGLIIGSLLAKAGPSNLRAFSIALLLFLFIDIQFSGVEKLSSFMLLTENWLVRALALTLVPFVAFFLLLTLRRRLATITTSVFATALITTIVLPIPQGYSDSGPIPVKPLRSPPTDLPLIIHLVVDGHIGIEGVPQDISGGPELRQRLIDFYDRWGFYVSGRAYSKYLMTQDSLSNLLNGTVSKNNAELIPPTIRFGQASWQLTQNLYFKQLAAKGYRARIYQSDYLDFCQAVNTEVEHCYVYASRSPRLIRDRHLPVIEKAELILGSYLGKSAVYSVLRVSYQGLRDIMVDFGLPELPRWERKNYEFSSLGVPTVLDRIKADIVNFPRGRLFFAHLLLPHGPYLWNQQCELRPDSDTWLSRRSEHKNVLSKSSPAYREKAYQVYFQQSHCLISLLKEFLETLDQQGLLKTATVIIHGDHGSRITIVDPVAPMLEYASRQDFVDAFSTLFAIRSPVLTPGQDEDPRSIQSLFAEHVLDIHPPVEDRSVLTIKTMGGKMELAPMPPF